MEEQATALRELVVMTGELTSELREALEANPLVDAFGAPTYGGPNQVIAYASAPSPGTTTNDICTGLDCVHYLIAQLSRVPPCGIPALRCNVKVMLQLEWRARRAFAAHFRELDGTFEDVTVAGALLTGSGPYNAMVEVVGDEEGPVFDALHALTDVDGLQLVAPLAFRLQDTYSWGTFRR